MHLCASPPTASSSPTAPHHKDSVKPQACPGNLSLQLSLAASAMAASISNPPKSAAHPRWSSPSPAPSNNAFSNATTATPTPFQVPHQIPPTPSSSTASSPDSPSPPPPPTPGPRALMNNSASTTQAAYQRPCPSRSGPHHGSKVALSTGLTKGASPSTSARHSLPWLHSQHTHHLTLRPHT